MPRNRATSGRIVLAHVHALSFVSEQDRHSGESIGRNHLCVKRTPPHTNRTQP